MAVSFLGTCIVSYSVTRCVSKGINHYSSAEIKLTVLEENVDSGPVTPKNTTNFQGLCRSPKLTKTEAICAALSGHTVL